MKILALVSVVVCLASLTGCSSPYLPHNAFRYIPELSQQEESNQQNSATDSEKTEGRNTMEKEPVKSFFSPGSIRERYAQHIQNETVNECDSLLDIACETVELMRRNGKSEDEIRAELKKKFHFSDDIIDNLMKA